MTRKFQIGDIVKLKTGSEEFEVLGISEGSPDHVLCRWAGDHGTNTSAYVSADALELIRPATPCEIKT